jgi:hypothetical protein
MVYRCLLTYNLISGMPVACSSRALPGSPRLRVSLLADSAVKDTRKRPAAGMPQLLHEANLAIAGGVHGKDRHRLIAQIPGDESSRNTNLPIP